MTNSVQHKTSLVLESEHGVTPATPELQVIKITGTTLALTKGTIESEAINPNRQVEDVRPGNRQIGGELGFELHYSGLDRLLEALLCGTWTPTVTVTASDISALASDNSINSAGAGFPVLAPGERIKIAGFTGTVGNNGLATVVSRTASKIVITDADDVDHPGITLVDDAAGEPVTVSSETMDLTPGTERRSFSVLREFTDLDPSAKPFHLYKGVEFNTAELTIAPESIVKGTLAVLGRDLAYSETEPSGASYLPASGNKPFDSFTGALSINDVDNGVVTEIKLSIENGLEPRFVAFSDLSLQPKIGKTRITGTITTYFETSEMLVAFAASERKKLFFTLTDEYGNTYEFLFPSIMPTGGQADVQGEADVTIPIPFSAIYDATDDVPHAMRIRRIPA